jgi:hypothetical protein
MPIRRNPQRSLSPSRSKQLAATAPDLAMKEVCQGLATAYAALADATAHVNPMRSRLSLMVWSDQEHERGSWGSTGVQGEDVISWLSGRCARGTGQTRRDSAGDGRI